MAKQKGIKTDLVNKSLALGIGLFDLTKNKVEKLVKDVTKDVSEKDKKKAVDDFFKFVDEGKKKLEKTLKTQVNSLAKEVEKATRTNKK